MANPQKEHGYLKIANELADSFCCLRLSDQEWRVLWTILRFSYGWNKKKAHLTLRQISEKTGIDVRHLPAIIRKLTEKCVVMREGKKFWLQKDYEKWNSPKRVTHKQVTPEQVKKVTQTGEKKSHEQVNESNGNHINDGKLQAPKDSIKDNYKDISLRERVFLKLKNHFPRLIVPDHVPTERMDFFLFLIETGGIKPSRIESPVAYMMSDKLGLEPFPNLIEREEEALRRKAGKLERIRREREEKMKRKFTRRDIESDPELMKLVSSVSRKLGVRLENTGI